MISSVNIVTVIKTAAVFKSVGIGKNRREIFEVKTLAEQVAERYLVPGILAMPVKDVAVF
jgi:hypothetical protein